MNYPPGDPQTLMAYRPDEIRSLIDLAQERIGFHADQIGVLQEGMQQIADRHHEIMRHYESMIARDQILIADLSRYLGGGSVAPQLQQHAQQASPHAQQAPLELSPEDQAIKDRVLSQFNSPGDMKPVKDPDPRFNGRTKREIVQSSKPIPQSAVSVMHYEAGEELPPEAVPGHMPFDGPEPRSAEELAADKASKQRAQQVSASVASAPAVPAVLVDGAGFKGPDVMVSDGEPPKPAATVVENGVTPPPIASSPEPDGSADVTS